ncbi:MAG: diaminopimelate epimerase [Gammaproteobacteria bacterium]|nr:diaminopimelate epimerase [Gammaproteobacteria bacterium]
MQISFSKMHGLGNDFIVIDAYRQPLSLGRKQVQALADRHRGIGCDQLLMVEPGEQSDVDFRYRIFNADGSEVEQCGNGARCFARFVHDHGLTDKREITVQTRNGIIRPRIEADGEVSVDMGVPQFTPDAIPFVADDETKSYPLIVAGEVVQIGTVSLGNPHAVILVEDVEQARVEQLGPQIENHPRFPQHVNVGFMQVCDRNSIKVRVYERGVGETLACGSGACAAVAVGHRLGLLDDEVNVTLRGGALQISWSGSAQPMLMKGPATHVFDGRIELTNIEPQT